MSEELILKSNFFLQRIQQKSKHFSGKILTNFKTEDKINNFAYLSRRQILFLHPREENTSETLGFCLRVPNP